MLTTSVIVSAQDPYLKFDLVEKQLTKAAIISISAIEDDVWIGNSEGLLHMKLPKDSPAVYSNTCIIDTIILAKIDSSAKKLLPPKKLIYSIAIKDSNEVWLSDIEGRLYCIRNKKLVFDTCCIESMPLRLISWANAEKTKLHLVYPTNNNDHNIHTIDIMSKKVEKDTELNKNNAKKQSNKCFLEGLATDNKDEIYLATNIGLMAYNAKNKEIEKISDDNTYKVIANIKQNEIYALSIIGNQTHFVVYSLDKHRKIRSFILPEVNNKERMSTMYLDNLGYIWLGSTSANIFYFKATAQNPAQNFFNLSNAAKMAGVTTNNTAVSLIDIVQTKDSSIWIATSVGLFRYGVLKIAPVVKIEKKDSIVAEKYAIANLSFEIGDSVINRDAYDNLNVIAKKMARDSMLILRINGHTDMPNFSDTATLADSIKAWEDMQTLSEVRARAVFQYLAKKGVSEERMEAKGYGASQPLNTPTAPTNKNNPATHSPNRRVEIEFIKISN